MNRYLDWRFRGTTWVALAMALACTAGGFLLPVAYGDKNCPVETVQMVILAICLWITCTAREKRPLYVFASLVLFFVLAREVNYGRTLSIFADPENANKFPKWKDMEYGWVAHLCVGLYMVWLVVYFCWRKVWKELWETCRGVKLPAADVLLALVGLAAALVFESAHDSLHEELGELLMYTAGMGVLYLYTRKKLISVD